MIWIGPMLNNLTGIWWMKIEGVSDQNLDNLYHHPLLNGYPQFLNKFTGKASICFNPEMVKVHGIHRCIEWLTEDILEDLEYAGWSFVVERACYDALHANNEDGLSYA